MAEDASGHFTVEGVLYGHGGWVTSLSAHSNNRNILLSGSRDKTCILWDFAANASSTPQVDGSLAEPKYKLVGHSDAVSDCTLSMDGRYAITASWDRTLRLWATGDNTKSPGQTMYRFPNKSRGGPKDGHTNDVLSVAFSPNNKHIMSGGRDKSMKLWTTQGECKFTVADQPHTDWVSCVRYSSDAEANIMVSGSWDHTVKVWDAGNLTCKQTLEGHTGYVKTVCLSPDGSLCASGGRDGKAKLWDLASGEHLYDLDAGESGQIHCLAFSPVRYWLVAGTAKQIKIWDLESKTVVAEFTPEMPVREGENRRASKAMTPECISLAWSCDGSKLYAGFTDNVIRVYGVRDA